MATATKTRRVTTESGNGQQPRPSVAAYFRQLFERKPQLLKAKTNEEILAQWKADHGVASIPENVRNTLANTKSQMKRGGSKRKRARAPAAMISGANLAGGGPLMIPAGGASIPNVQIGDVLAIRETMEKGRRLLNISLRL